MSDIHPQENSYVIDQESGAEMARLVDQDRMATHHMGGLFPQNFDLSNVHTILDIACGPGGWVQEVAFAHRDKHVVGIDISTTMLDYARAQAKVQGLKNTHFHLMDATSPFTFPDASFDFVNARFIVGFMWKEAWPQLIHECARILRPGGTLCITETDSPGIGITSSPALERYIRLIGRALFRTGRTFCPDEDGGHLGITPRLRGFFSQAGFQQMREQPHMINYSADMEAHMHNSRNLQVAMKLLQPFLQKTNVASREELDQLHQQMVMEMYQPDFCGIWYFMSITGQKPPV